MAAGVRVIRGPDWSKGDEDGGEGHVGTVVHYGSNGTAEVVWDSGQVGTYRIGQGGKHDLRILDNATVGVRHTKICDGCTENGIMGIRWKCAKCDDVDLCSFCYVTDKHDLTHPFLCIEAVGANPVQVSQRNRSMKVRALGIFPDAMVVRGRDWKWDNQDGGKQGTVTELKTPESRSARSTVSVKWASGNENTYRVGHQGCVDLRYVDEAPGPEYYPQHLPVLDAAKTTLPNQGKMGDSGIQEGDKVCIELDEAALKELQKAAGGWSAGMSQLIGKVGVVRGFSQTGDASVEFGKQKWRIVPTALRKVPSLSVDDVVEIIDDKGKVETLQEDHGGWLDVMAAVLGKRGRVVKVDDEGDVVVKFGSKMYLFNPACCTKVDGDVDDDDDDDDDDNKNDDDSDDGSLTTSQAELLGQQLGGGFANFIAGLALLEALSEAQQEAGSTVFIKAIVEGNTDRVRRLLQQDSDLANAVHNGIPALQIAAHQGELEIVKILIEKGASKNVKDKDGDTALNLAICRQHTNIAEFLIRVGADLNICNEKKRGPLHNAAYTGQTRLVKLLITKNCDVNAKDLGGDTPLHDAIEKEHEETAIALIAAPRLDLRISNVKGFAAIHTAGLKGNATIVERLIMKNRTIANMGKNDGFTVLHLAAFNDHTDVIRVLAKVRVDMNSKTKLGQTPLHLACEKAHFNSVQLLVESGANVNVGDSDGDTPLHIAMMMQTGNIMLRLLIGQLPQLDEGVRVRIATYLIQHGANPDARNKRNMTPSQVCRSEGIKQAVESFRKTNVKSRPMSPDGRPLLCSKCMNVRANALYLPCGHKDTCQKCCKNVKNCGICGRDVSKKVNEEGATIGECVIQ